MPLEPADQQYWQSAVGYVELGMFTDADSELEKIDPFNRAVPEVLAVRLSILVRRFAGLCSSLGSGTAKSHTRTIARLDRQR